MEANELLLKEKQAMLDRQSKSGQSIHTFCKSEQIAYHHFFYWQKKLRTAPSISLEKFIDLGSSIKSLPSIEAEVIAVNGTRIIFHTLPTASFLKSLLD